MPLSNWGGVNLINLKLNQLVARGVCPISICFCAQVLSQVLHKSCTSPVQVLASPVQVPGMLPVPGKSCTSPVQVLHKSCTSPAQVLYKSCTSPGKSCTGQCQDSACAWPAQCLCKSCAGRLHRQGLRDLPCLLPTLPSHKSWSLQVLAEDALCAVLCIRHSGPFCLYFEIQPKCLPRMLCVLCLCLHQTVGHESVL